MKLLCNVAVFQQLLYLTYTFPTTLNVQPLANIPQNTSYLQTLHDSKRNIPVFTRPEPHVVLLKRANVTAFLDIRGIQPDERGHVHTSRPMSYHEQRIVEQAVEQARQLAVAALQLEIGNPLYAQVMGDPGFECYDLVSQMLRRVVNLWDTGTAEELPGGIKDGDRVEKDFKFVRDDWPRDFGNTSNIIATTREGMISLYNLFFLYPPFFHISGGLFDFNDSKRMRRALDSARMTRAAIMLHELIHLVSRNEMQLLYSRALKAGSTIPNMTEPNGPPRVIDVRLGYFQAPTKSTEHEKDDAILEDMKLNKTSIAYSAKAMDAVAKLTFGRFAAAANAANYEALAIAAMAERHNIEVRKSGRAG